VSVVKLFIRMKFDSDQTVIWDKLIVFKDVHHFIELKFLHRLK
jgi:hypothetical protein